MEEKGRIKRLSPHVVMNRLPGVHKKIPARALVMSVVAFLIAIWGAFTSPAFLAGYDALSWILILIPAFLFAYYRGWRGAASVVAVGTFCLLGLELAAEHLLHIPVDWLFLFWVAVVLLGVEGGLGILSELLHRERRQALAFAYTDPLTGLPNRHLLDGVLGVEFTGALAKSEPLSVVLFDLDGFGSYNARFGRPAGDAALEAIAECLDQRTVEMTLVGRYGGDRFLAVLPGEKAHGAWMIAERACQIIAGMAHHDGTRLCVSAGVAGLRVDMEDPLDLVDAAETGLREAQSLGGNRVRCVPHKRRPDASPKLQQRKRRDVMDRQPNGAGKPCLWVPAGRSLVLEPVC